MLTGCANTNNIHIHGEKEQTTHEKDMIIFAYSMSFS
jgi:hypothetical protein